VFYFIVLVGLGWKGGWKLHLSREMTAFLKKQKFLGMMPSSFFRDERRANSKTFIPASSDGGAPWCVAVLLSLAFKKLNKLMKDDDD